MNIGILGGTFDPIHFGHIGIAIHILEKLALDQIWFVPAKINPLKTDQEPLSLKHRLAMLSLALESHPQLMMKNLEGSREGPSFTIDTLRELTTTTSNRYHLIIGEDCLEGFLSWKEPEAIIEEATLIVMSRGSKIPNLSHFEKHEQIASAIHSGWIETHLMDLSSSDIRKRLTKRLYCRHLVPEKVIDYIYEHHLY